MEGWKWNRKTNLLNPFKHNDLAWSCNEIVFRQLKLEFDQTCNNKSEHYSKTLRDYEKQDKEVIRDFLSKAKDPIKKGIIPDWIGLVRMMLNVEFIVDRKSF